MSHEINIRKNGVYILPTKGKYCDRDTALNVRVSGGGGTYTPILQDKSATPTKSKQTFTADAGFDGIGTFTVEPIPNEYIIPSGTKEITTNGTHDVTDKASVNVNVPIPDGYIKPSGTIEITESGTYDVTNYASAEVNVSGGGSLVEYSGEVWHGVLGGTTTQAITINMGTGIEIPEKFFFIAWANTWSVNAEAAVLEVGQYVDGTQYDKNFNSQYGTVMYRTETITGKIVVSADRTTITINCPNTTGFVGGTWTWKLVTVGG